MSLCFFLPSHSTLSSVLLLPLLTASILTFLLLSLIFSSLSLPLNLPCPCLIQLFAPPSLLLSFSPSLISFYFSPAAPINHLFLAPLSLFSPGLCSARVYACVCSRVNVCRPGRPSVVYFTAFVRPCYQEKHSGRVCVPMCGLNIRACASRSMFQPM